MVLSAAAFTLTIELSVCQSLAPGNAFHDNTIRGCSEMSMHYLTLCCIAKEETPFLKEWLAYHAQRGVEHFYVYDNMSQTPIRDVLGGFADGKRATVLRVPGKSIQLSVYKDCLKNFGAQSRWMGFLDLDEFVFPREDTDIRVFLSEFEAYGGLAATWWLFNSSGHLKRPDGLVLQNYTEAFAEQNSYHVKCFVNPARTEAPLSPHHFQHSHGAYCVNEDHVPLSPWRQFTVAEGRRIRINHYFVRSQQDFEEKIRRGRADDAADDRAYDMTMFMSALNKPSRLDTGIFQFVPELAAALERNKMPAPSPLPDSAHPFETLMDAALAFLDVGQPEKCLACLCYADEEARKKADYWTLRSMAAQIAGNVDRAERFIHEALRLECAETAYAQWQRILRAKGKNTLADGVAQMMQGDPAIFL
ncbi:glycosyltransferase family 2 protein [Desulfovibrio sp. OttesenSCG-928-G15]|nr:glycosyltransferase family 2 protein [Desulfovibrio sp. OttesenSCG-928-G15]